MILLALTRFAGVAPKIAPSKLPVGFAQQALNTRMTGGTLHAWKQTLSVLSGLTPADTSTIYRFGKDLVSDTQYWFHWGVDVDAVKGAISDDATERTYFTHPSLGPRVTNNSLALTGGSGDYPWNSHALGVPAPTPVPTAEVLVPGDTSSPVETRVYVYTFVTAFGEEGPPGPPSNALAVYTSGSTTRLSGMGTSAPGGYANVTAKRIYRTLSGNLGTEFQLVDEIPISQATYDDTKAGALLGEVIPSMTWNPPPSGCFGITQMANGIMLVFKGYDIYPSEAYLPYAYPIGYSQSVDSPIVGAKGLGSSAVILTSGHPYLLTGSDPSAMSLEKLVEPQACVSKRSIAAIGGGVLYASPDGLILVTGQGQVSNVTAQFFGRDEWQTLNPASIKGWFHDGRYIGFYNTGVTTGGFIFDPAEGASALVFTDVYATAGYSDPLQDALYLKVGGEIVRWHAGAARMTYTWRSGVVDLPKPVNPACAQVVATAYPVTFKLYADGVLRHTQAVANRNSFWLPSGYLANSIEVELSGTNEVQAVFVAQSPADLARI